MVGQDVLGLPLSLGMSPKGEHERVIGELVAIPGDRAVAGMLHAVERSTMPVSVELGRRVL